MLHRLSEGPRKPIHAESLDCSTCFGLSADSQGGKPQVTESCSGLHELALGSVCQEFHLRLDYYNRASLGL